MATCNAGGWNTVSCVFGATPSAIRRAPQLGQNPRRLQLNASRCTARLFLTARGDIGYTLKTPYHDGTTHVIFEPLDSIARLAALVPPPRLNLTRFHGVFAPNSPHRARITPACRGRGARPTKPTREEDRTPAERRSAIQWATRLGPA